MRQPRIYQNQPLNVAETITLDDNAIAHLIRVLRLPSIAQLSYSMVMVMTITQPFAT